MTNPNTQKVALIVAGGSGLGAAAAQELHQRGFRIAILSSSGKGEALARSYDGIGFTGSNLDNQDLSAFVDKVMSAWGRIDVVVSSSGHGPKGDLLEIADEDWGLAMDYYLLNVVRVARLVTPIMEQQGGGTFLNISTYAVFEPDPLFPTSSVMRAGLASFSKLFADRYAAANIRMNNILPGFIDSLPVKEERLNRIPMERYGKMREVAGLIGYLASDEGGYITGQNICVDGGLTRSI